MKSKTVKSKISANTKLSSSQTKKIESNIRVVAASSREEYYSREIERYNNLRTIID